MGRNRSNEAKLERIRRAEEREKIAADWDASEAFWFEWHANLRKEREMKVRGIFANIPKICPDRSNPEDMGNNWHTTTEDNDSEFLEAL